MSKKTKEFVECEAVVENIVESVNEEHKSYSIEQLVKSLKFKGLSDIVRSVVDVEEMVTIEEVEKRIEKFLSMEVR